MKRLYCPIILVIFIAVSGKLVSQCDLSVIASSDTICFGENTTLSATLNDCSGDFNYSWMPGDSTTSSIVVSPNSNMTYFLTITSTTDQDSVFTDSIEIIVNPLPIIESIADTSVCVGTFFYWVPQVPDDPMYNFEYIWSPAGELPDEELRISSVGLSDTDNYTVTVTSNEGCIDSTAFNLIVNPPPDINVINGTTLCEGEMLSIEADAEDGSLYYWDTNDDEGALLEIDAVELSDAIVYTVIVISLEDCVDSTTFELMVNENPEAAINGLEEVCIGASITLEGNPSGGSDNYNHFWESSDTQIATVSSGSMDATVNTIIPGETEIEYLVIDDNNCKDSIALNFQVHEQPQAQLYPLDSAICSIDPVTLLCDIIDLNSTYSFIQDSYIWYLGPDTNGTVFGGNVESFTFIPDILNTEFTVNPMLLPEEAACTIDPLTIDVEMLVSDIPNPDAIALNDQICSNQTSVFVAGNVGNSTSFNWSTLPEDLIINSEEQDDDIFSIDWGNNSGDVFIILSETLTENCIGYDTIPATFASGSGLEPGEIFLSDVNDIFYYHDYNSNVDCYQWGKYSKATLENTAIEDETYQSYVADGVLDTLNYIYWCKAWVKTGDSCGSPPQCPALAVYKKSNIEIDAHNSPKFSLYPNPNNGNFRVEANNLFADMNYQWIVYNAYGQMLKSIDFHNEYRELNMEIHAGEMNPGLYFLGLYRNGILEKSTKFIIQSNK